ncbi:nitrate/nitrite transporter NarK [Paraburkholderia sp. GAS333]
MTNFALLANVVTALWLPSLIKGSGISDPLHIGWMTSIPYAVAITTMILVARNSDRTGERRWHAVVPALVASIGVIWMSFSLHEPVMLVFAAALCIGGALTLNALFWNLPTALLSGNAAVVGIAFINSVGQLAGFTAPAVFGWLFQKSGSPAYGLLSLGALFAVGGLAVLCIPKTAVNR